MAGIHKTSQGSTPQRLPVSGRVRLCWLYLCAQANFGFAGMMALIASRNMSQKICSPRHACLVTFFVLGVSVVATATDRSSPQLRSFDRPDGGSGSWLDGLKSSSRKNPGSSQSRPGISAEGDRDDFDLSEFSQEPAARVSSIKTSHGTPNLAQLQHQLPEPAEPQLDPESVLSGTEHSSFSSEPGLTVNSVFSECQPGCQQNLCWEVLPKGLIFKTYMAGEKEPRMQFVSFYDTKSQRKLWEAVLGGRVGLVRYSDPSISNGDAFQLDLEGAVFARVLPDEPSAMLEGSDYRVGLYGTWRQERWSYRAGYYHISSHVGDEFLIANPLFNRINYVRDSLLAGAAYQLDESTRVYGEVGYALGIEGGAKPLEFQFGAEYTPLPQTTFVGAPFAAVNGHLREDFNFSGGVNIVSGWGWQGVETKRRLRVGLNYYHGPSLQYEFFDRWENLVGGGIWVDY